MNKETLLQELSTKIHNSEISREEVMSRLNIPSTTQKEDGKDIKKFSHFSITKYLYLGAAIVVIGVIIFIVQVWEDIGSFSRILITLGLGLLITAIGSVLLKQKREDNIGMIFHFIGGLLIPGGAIVTLHEFNVEIVSLWPFAITFGVIFAFYLLLNTIHKHAILTFFTIANGTAFIYLLFGAIINDLLYRQQEDLYAYLTMIIGVSYLLLGYTFRNGWNKKLIEVLYFLGIIGVLGAAFSQVFDSAFWESLYLFIVLGGLFLSVYMKSRIILVMSTLFLVAYISYITSEYFADSLGWPISLIILGFIFIGLGYASITINKKYIK